MPLERVSSKNIVQTSLWVAGTIVLATLAPPRCAVMAAWAAMLARPISLDFQPAGNRGAHSETPNSATESLISTVFRKWWLASK